MAMLTIDRPSLERAAAQNNCIEFNEPTCGAGGMIIEAAEALRTPGFDPVRHMRVTAQDIDIARVQMTYLTCSIYDRTAEHTSELNSILTISSDVLSMTH